MAQQGVNVTYSEGGFLDRIPWYIQLLVLIAAILLILFVVDYFVMAPKRLDASKKEAAADQLRRENQEADIVRANIAEFQQRLDGLNGDLDRLKVRLPEQREVTNIFEAAKQMMASSGLNLVQFQTTSKDREVPQKFYTEVPSTVKVAGRYSQVQALFEKLSGYERIVNVTDITLARATDKDQVSGASTLASFTLTAFYISEANRTALENPQDQPQIDPKTGKPIPPKPGAKPAPKPGAPGAPPAPAPK